MAARTQASHLAAPEHPAIELADEIESGRVIGRRAKVPQALAECRNERVTRAGSAFSSKFREIRFD
jgi:hypothetical protein